MDEGGHRSASGRGPVEALAGHIITSNPGEVHDGTPLGRAPRRWRMVHVTPEAMAGLVGQSDQEVTRPVLHDPRLQQSIAQLLNRWSALTDHGDTTSQLLWEEALAQTCGLLLQAHGNRPTVNAAPARLARVRECLLDQLQTPPSLSDLAGLSGLSRFQLVRQFAKAHGLPPFAWRQQHRLRLARQLIAEGMALGEAAAASGFADQSHLHRHFVHCFGFTPGQWQGACRGPLQQRSRQPALAD
jgi:AraC-like DNA-binding protein